MNNYLAGYDGWKLEAPPAALDYVAICVSCGGEIEAEEDVMHVGGRVVCCVCAREEDHV